MAITKKWQASYCFPLERCTAAGTMPLSSPTANAHSSECVTHAREPRRTSLSKPQFVLWHDALQPSVAYSEAIGPPRACAARSGAESCGEVASDKKCAEGVSDHRFM